MRPLLLVVLSALTVVLVALPLAAQAAEDVYTQRTLDLARKLECPVCNGQTVADGRQAHGA